MRLGSLLGLLAASCGSSEPEEIWEDVVYIDEAQLLCHDAAGGELTVTVVASDCMSSSCSRNVTGSCSLSLAGDEVLVESEVRWQRWVNADGCTTDCRSATATCTLGAVPDGTYTLVLGDMTQSIEVPGHGGEDPASCGFYD